LASAGSRQSRLDARDIERNIALLQAAKFELV
jgi:hypothetical protein